MVPAQNIATLRRNVACNKLQCLSATAKFGIAMCIVLVTLGSAFIYYWAFIRGRRNRDTDNRIDDSVHELSVVNRTEINLTSPQHRSYKANDQVITHRPKPAPPTPPAVSFQQTPNDVAMPPFMQPPRFILPGPPMFLPAYVMHQQPVFVPLQATVSIRPPPLAPSIPLGPLPGALQSPGHLASRRDQHGNPVQPRRPSPGYANTISDSSPARRRSVPPVEHHSPKESASRASSHSSSLGTESRARFEELVAHSGLTEPVDEDNVHHPGTSSAANRRPHRRQASDSNDQEEEQSRIGRPRVQSVGQPRLATRRSMHDIFGAGDTRVGREHRRESRGRRQHSRPRPFSAFFGVAESYVGRPDSGRCISRENQLDNQSACSSAQETYKVRNSTEGRKNCGRDTSGDHRHGPPRATQAQNDRGRSPAQSGVSSTGAICSFDGSDQHQQGSSQGYSSQRYRRRDSSRSVSIERGLGHPRRVTSNPASVLGRHPTVSRDLSLVSKEDDAEDDGRHGQHN